MKRPDGTTACLVEGCDQARHGNNARCHAHHLEMLREQAKDPDRKARRRAQAQLRYARDPEKRKARERERWTPERQEQRRARNYGMSVDEFHLFVDKRDGRCEACGRTEADTGKKHHVDHDHACCPGLRTCGRCVRGFLCEDCNLALGKLADDPERVGGLLRYIGGWDRLRVLTWEGDQA